jgi:hypothetical protein
MNINIKVTINIGYNDIHEGTAQSTLIPSNVEIVNHFHQSQLNQIHV